MARFGVVMGKTTQTNYGHHRLARPLVTAIWSEVLLTSDFLVRACQCALRGTTSSVVL